MSDHITAYREARKAWLKNERDYLIARAEANDLNDRRQTLYAALMEVANQLTYEERQQMCHEQFGEKDA
ncbi:MAG: hypothetical protein ACXV2C_00745 [Candidatus Bathyarchaeia archaeon]